MKAAAFAAFLAVPFHGFCWAKSVSVWIHKLVRDDDVPTETRSRQIGESEHAQLGLGEWQSLSHM